MSHYKKVTHTQLPEKIKILATMHQNPSLIDIYECKEKDDLYALSEQFPLETTCVANNANETKMTVGWFIVGISIPNAKDEFKRPVMAYYYMNNADYRSYRDDILKEVDRRKKLYNETRTGWKNLLRS